jgi:toxin FitB
MSALRNIPAIDGLMAATAKVDSLILATRSVAHVADLGASVLNPFAAMDGGA